MTTQQTFAQKFQQAHEAMEAGGERWTDLRLAVFLETTPTTIWRWRNGKAPDVVKQEGVLARMWAEARKKKPKD